MPDTDGKTHRETEKYKILSLERSSGLWLHVVLCSLLLCGEDGGSLDLRNIGILPQHYTASKFRRPRLESSPPWKPAYLIWSRVTGRVKPVTSKMIHVHWRYHSVCGITGRRQKLLVQGCIQKFPDWVDNEIYAYNNKQSLRSNTKCYGDKTQ
jgi:hypothetical protein